MKKNLPAADAHCPWESGELGASEEHAVRRSPEDDRALDEAMELQMISVRLPKALIDDLKFLAAREGLKYQPLMRRVLTRFAAGELKSIAIDQALLEQKAKPKRERAREKAAEQPKVARRA